MIDYAQDHFTHEELLFGSSKYPDIDKHVKAHRDFIEELLKVQRNYEGGAALSIIELCTFLARWIKEHTSKMDTAFGPYIKTDKNSLDSLKSMLNY